MRSRPRPARAAAVATVLIAAVVYLAFAKQVPLRHDFEVSAVVRTANDLQPGNPVRVAGLDIGQVVDVAAGPGRDVVVTLRIDDASSLREDASLSIRPRLFLEGNFYVDMQPGTPGAGPLRDDTRIPVERTSGPVQLDQLLSTFAAPTRDALISAISELGNGLSGSPSGAAGFRRTSRELARSLDSFTRAAQAARGTRPGDLVDTVASSSDVAAQLGADPRHLAGLVSDFNGVTAALADRDAQLRASLRGLARLVRTAPGQLDAIAAAMPALRRYAAVLRPALRAAPRPLGSIDGVLAQVEALSRQPELPAFVRALAPAASALPQLESRLLTTFPLVTRASRCISRNVVETMNKEVPDGALSTGRPAWQDMLHMAAALTGTSPGFDGNGGTLRIGVAEGSNAMRGLLGNLGTVTSSTNLEGVRPRWLGQNVVPQFRPDAWCDQQPLPDLAARNGDAAALPGWEPLRAAALPAADSARQRSILRRLLGGRRERRALRRELLGGRGR